ncbi:MAG: organic solvent tolerance protein OstA, partial [Rhodospirillales bacterium]
MTAARNFAAAAVAVWMLAGLSAGATAQSLNLGAGDETPIEIFADNGIEWQQDNLVFLAKGNAKAVRGDITVLADQLTAFYTE